MFVGHMFELLTCIIVVLLHNLITIQVTGDKYSTAAFPRLHISWQSSSFAISNYTHSNVQCFYATSILCTGCC